MKVSISKSKNTTIYYLSKTVRIGNKSTTKTVEKIGTVDEIKKKCGDMDPLDWAKQYAAQRTAEEKKSKQDILVRFSSSAILDSYSRNSCNAGYLFLQDIYYSLGLKDICDSISKKHKFQFDLNDILSNLVYTRILAPGSKRASIVDAQRFIEQPKADLHQVYRALNLLAADNDFLQAELYKNSENVIDRKKGVLYYDCTNYYFEIEQEDDFRKYGLSKQHQPLPIVQMGLFMDANGIPLSFSLFEGNQNEQPTMTPLEKKLIHDFGESEFVVCTDAGLSSTANRRFNDRNGRKFVTTQSVKKLKGFLQDFCLSDDGWRLEGSRKSYRLSELDYEKDYDKTFYKDRWINEDGLEQHLIVTYSIKYREYQRQIRERQIERAQKYLTSPSKLKKANTNDPKRFITQEHCTSDGEMAERTITGLNHEMIENEARYDGFYAVCTNLEDNPSTIIAINRKRWEIEECFRIMKTEFQARPVFLSRKDRITAHFMTCFIALIIYRILEKKLLEKFTCDEIIKTLKTMDMMILPGEGYVPTYTRTELTDALHDAFGFRTDYRISSQKNIRKILNQTKKREK